LDRRHLDRRQHERLARPGRRQSDRRLPAADLRRVMVVGPNDAWRRLTAYLFEEAGYAVYAAADRRQAVASTTRRLPDVVVVQMEPLDTLDVVTRLSETSSTSDIPVVVLATALQSTEARAVRATGGVTLLPYHTDGEVLIAEVETLMAVAPRAQRALKRRLVDLQDVARYCTPDAEGQARLRGLIDCLHVAVFVVDAQGQCIAASHGATTLTGYSRRQLLTTSVFQVDVAGGRVSDERWRRFLANQQYAGTTTITTQAGEDVTVHVAAVAEILPGVHVAAVAAA
jgi:PAS domain S-box-containing protein